MKKKWFIYIITNDVNTKWYIGMTTNPDVVVESFNYGLSTPSIRSTIAEYGIDKFHFEVIFEFVSKEFLAHRIKYNFIRQYESFFGKGYNTH